MKPRRNFDEVAASWDENPGRLKVIGDIAFVMFDRIVLTSGMDVLDFGCGTGLLSLRIADQVKALTGVDSSIGMLDKFAAKANELRLENVGGIHVDIDQGGAIPGQYDLIVSSMVFHHIENIAGVLARLHDALKPGGMLCVADLDLDGGLFHEDHTGVFHDGFDREEFRQAMERAGFRAVCIDLATEILRPKADGMEHRFTIFVATGIKQTQRHEEH